MICAGIDIGSRNSKLVVVDCETKQIIFSSCYATEIDVSSLVERMLAEYYANPDFVAEPIQRIASTGYGRHSIKIADKAFSEISCHARGVLYFFPKCHCIIDIGGQDSKIITIGTDGKVKDFVMNDKCAAGTGRFLEITALRLGKNLDELSLIAGKSSVKLDINSTCVVFAESEIIGHLSLGAEISDIVRAVNFSIAHRIVSQMSSLAWKEEVVFTGGVALNSDLAICIESILKNKIHIPPDPEITGALGAALIIGYA